MKITPTDYAILHTAITQARNAWPHRTMELYKSQGLTHKRWRWDLLWLAKRDEFLPDRFIEDTLYGYCDDTHIDTALRRIVG